MKMKRIYPAAGVIICALLLLLTAATAAAAPASPNDKKKADLERKVKDLERQIREGERVISTIKNDKSAAQERARRLSRQIEVRNDLLLANERKARLLQEDVERADSALQAVSTRLTQRKSQYAEMVRESYRNYRNDNYLSYIFSADGFLETARRIAVLREVAESRGARIREIAALNDSVSAARDNLGRQKAALDSARRRTASEKEKLQQDEKAARTAISNLTAKERAAVKKKAEQERIENGVIVVNGDAEDASQADVYL